MEQLRRTIAGRPRLALALLALALAARALVPAGWMTSAAPQGVALSICTGMGVAEMVLGADGKLHEKPPAHQDGDHPCAFAGLAAALDATPPLTLAPAAPAPAPAAPQRRAGVAVGRGLAAPPPPATGPPALS